MNLDLLATLKDKMLHAARLADVMTYFLDHFGEDREFIGLGESIRHSFLEGVLAVIGGQLFGKEVVVMDLLLTRVPGRTFIHGGCVLNRCVGTVLYFEDVAVGLLAVAGPAFPGETKFVRFTGKPLAPPPGFDKPSAN